MSAARRGPYFLEVYKPGSTREVWCRFESATPFMTLSAGDMINPNVWEGSQSPRKMLRVTGVEHAIWEKDGRVKHKVKVYSEEVESTEALPLGPSVLS